MPEQTIDLKKRRFLTQATSVVGAVGVGFVAWPFLSTWKPSARTRAAGAPVDVDISKLQTGQLVRVLWRKKPVWIFKRSAEALAALESDAVIKNLSDPDGSGYSKNQQPKYVTTSYRSIKKHRRDCGYCWRLYSPGLLSNLSPRTWRGGSGWRYLEGRLLLSLSWLKV